MSERPPQKYFRGSNVRSIETGFTGIVSKVAYQSIDFGNTKPGFRYFMGKYGYGRWYQEHELSPVEDSNHE